MEMHQVRYFLAVVDELNFSRAASAQRKPLEMQRDFFVHDTRSLTVLPMINTIDNYDYPTAFVWFALVQGAVVLLCAYLMRAPVALRWTETAAGSSISVASGDFTWRQMLRRSVIFSSIGISIFLLLYYAAVGLFPLYLSSIFKFTLA